MFLEAKDMPKVLSLQRNRCLFEKVETSMPKGISKVIVDAERKRRTLI